METLYQLITEKLNGIIPVEWRRIVLYAEVVFQDSSEVYFYFETHESEKLIHSHSIPEVFTVSESVYMDLLSELHGLFRDLQNEFRSLEAEVWSNLTLFMERTGKFKIDYQYGDVLNTGLDEMQRQYIWEYKNLGLVPEDESDRKFLEEYLKNNDEAQN